jgi:hypothetical protein
MYRKRGSAFAFGGKMRRVNIRAVLGDPVQRRELMVRCIVAIQAREGIETTQEQAEAAYDRVQGFHSQRPGS